MYYGITVQVTARIVSLRFLTGYTVCGCIDVDSECSLWPSAEEFIRSPHWRLLPLDQFRWCRGFGLKSATHQLARRLAGLRRGKGVSQAQSGTGGRKGCSPLLSCMPVDSATAYVRNGIASEAHVRNGGAKRRGRPCGGKFMRRRRSWKRGSERRGGTVGLTIRWPRMLQFCRFMFSGS